jgi:predicted Co/Zn/Cd cation transporter (cation efflux family)
MTTAVVARGEARGLRLSIQVVALLSVAGIVIGIASGSRLLLLEGAVAAVGAASAWLALRALRAGGVQSAPHHPYGPAALPPLLAAVHGLAIAALMVFAAADAVAALLAGGRRVDLVLVIGFAVLAAVACAVCAAVIGRAREGALGEAVRRRWRDGALRFTATAVLAGSALALSAGGVLPAAAAWADPILVLVACASMLPSPARALRRGLEDLLEAMPDGHTLLAIERAVDGVTARFDLPGPEVRSTCLGRSLHVDVVFLVDPAAGPVTIDREDEVRRAVHAALEALPYDVQATVELTTDPALA